MTFSCNGHSMLSFSSSTTSIWFLILHHLAKNAGWNSFAVLNSVSSTVGFTVSIITILLLVCPVPPRGLSGLLVLWWLPCYLYSSTRVLCMLGAFIAFCDAGFGKGLVSSLRSETQKKLVPILSYLWLHD